MPELIAGEHVARVEGLGSLGEDDLVGVSDRTGVGGRRVGHRSRVGPTVSPCRIRFVSGTNWSASFIVTSNSWRVPVRLFEAWTENV